MLPPVGRDVAHPVIEFEELYYLIGKPNHLHNALRVRGTPGGKHLKTGSVEIAVGSGVGRLDGLEQLLAPRCHGSGREP